MSNDSVIDRPASTAASPPPRTEAEFLARQQRQALRSLRQTGRDLGETAKELADRHPWVTLGAAAVAGALAARALSPSLRAGPSSESRHGLADFLTSVAQNSLLAALAGFQTTRHSHNGEETLPAP